MANSDEFINSVEEELRHDKLRGLWKRWQYVFYAGVAAIVLAVGGRELWNWHEATEAAKASDQYTQALQALDKGDFDTAKTNFDTMVAKAPAGYKSAALQGLAELSLRKGDTVAALATLEKAATIGPDADMRAAAAIKAAYIAMEKEDTAKLAIRLKPVLEAKGPFASMAKEILAAKAFDEGRLDEARIQYEALGLALDAPESVKQRAQVALALLPPAVKATVQPAPAAPTGKPASAKGE